MAKRGLELNTRITALDEASKVVDKVARKMGDLEDKKHVAEIDADGTKAENEIKSIDRRLGDLTDEDRVAVLEVQAKQAKREVDQLTRKLANADKYDDDEITLFVEARDNATKKLQGIQAELRELGDEAGDASDEISDKLGGAFDGLSGRFEGIGGKLGGKLAGGFAAVGVGALMVEALNSSWERAGGVRRIEGQFRLTEQQAAEYGETAGRLYAENWGESVVELQQLVALAGERLEDVTGSSLETISAQIQATADVWGEDYEAIIRSITQLTQNDLADSSQEALDLIVTGFQDGANEAGDFLDTIDEYAQQFEAVGLSGEDALNIIVAGLQNGQRDTDKLADAVKELRIRAVEDTDAISEAYETLGLSADDTREAFLAGGETARDAYLLVLEALDNVEDPIEKNRLAVELIGTQFEDLGPTAITSLRTVEGALRDTEGAAEDLANTVLYGTPAEEFKREGEESLGLLGDALANQFGPMLRDTNDFIDGLSNGWGLWGDDAVEVSDEVAGAAEMMGERINTAFDDIVDRLQMFTTESTYTADAQDELRVIAGLTGDELDDQADSADDAADALDDLYDSTKKAKDEFSRLKTEIDDQQAWIRFLDTAEDINATLADQETDTRDAMSAVLDYKEAVIEYAEVIDLPDTVTTRLLALIDQDKRAEVERFLERMQNGVTLPIKPFVLNGGRGPRVTAEGNLIPQGATGGIVTKPTLALIGEAGPEAVVPLNKTPGSSPIPNGGFGMGGNITVHINGGYVDDRTISELENRLDQWRRSVR